MATHCSVMIIQFIITDFDGGWREREKTFVYMYTRYIQCKGFTLQNQDF